MFVLERGRVGESWRGLWESFCLVTPNWTMQLPDQLYDGEDPHAFDARDEIVGFLERYVARFDVPVQEDTEVHSLHRLEQGGFLLETSAGPIEARGVVLAAGAFQRVHFLRKRKSSSFTGVCEDAPIVAHTIVEARRGSA